MAIRDLSTLGLGELLGALLTSVVEAQQAATASTIEFIEQIGLTEDGFRTVSIKYRKLDENQQPADFVLEVPLLAMVPIPTLQVRQAKMSFRYDVTEATTVTPPATGAEPPPRIIDVPQLRPVVLKGVVNRSPVASSASSTSRETAGIDIEVTVESEALPAGLERILELTELTVSEPVPKEDG